MHALRVRAIEEILGAAPERAHTYGPEASVRLLATTCDYLRLPATTRDYLRLLAITCDYLRLPETTRDYLRLLAITCYYTRLPETTCDYLRLLATTCFGNFHDEKQTFRHRIFNNTGEKEPFYTANSSCEGAALAERLDHSPPTGCEPGSIPAGSPADFHEWESCGDDVPLVGGFSRGSPQCTILNSLHLRQNVLTTDKRGGSPDRGDISQLAAANRTHITFIRASRCQSENEYAPHQRNRQAVSSVDRDARVYGRAAANEVRRVLIDVRSNMPGKGREETIVSQRCRGKEKGRGGKKGRKSSNHDASNTFRVDLQRANPRRWLKLSPGRKAFALRATANSRTRDTVSPRWCNFRCGFPEEEKKVPLNPLKAVHVRSSAGMKGRGKREIPGVTRPGIEPGSPWWEASRLTAQPPELDTISAYTRQQAKPKWINRVLLERASQKQSSDTHKTPCDGVKRCRERKIYFKAPERVNPLSAEDEEVFKHLPLQAGAINHGANFPALTSVNYDECSCRSRETRPWRPSVGQSGTRNSSRMPNGESEPHASEQEYSLFTIINLRKMSLLLPAYILTGALTGMRPVKLVTMDGKRAGFERQNYYISVERTAENAGPANIGTFLDNYNKLQADSASSAQMAASRSALRRSTHVEGREEWPGSLRVVVGAVGDCPGARSVARRCATTSYLGAARPECETRAGMKRVGETGEPRENPWTSRIVRHDSHARKSGVYPAGNRTRSSTVDHVTLTVAFLWGTSMLGRCAEDGYGVYLIFNLWTRVPIALTTRPNQPPVSNGGTIRTISITYANDVTLTCAEVSRKTRWKDRFGRRRGFLPERRLIDSASLPPLEGAANLRRRTRDWSIGNILVPLGDWCAVGIISEQSSVTFKMLGRWSAQVPPGALPTGRLSTSVDLCFTAFGVGPLVFVRGSMNTEAYCNILDNEMLPTLWRFYGMDPCYFQDDNARCHVSRATMQWYAANNVRQLDWPTQSSDLNPIRTSLGRVGSPGEGSSGAAKIHCSTHGMVARAMATNPRGCPANTRREHARQGGCCYSRKRWPYEIITG
ncbi:hypothetical protein PR048_033437 [Dryococelus australis]|uniref:Transposase n=1 Tax=Dryococelus australis TaxID=614101 RepID=A0ABQ9G095_9NEOP|nr:hypothetical protein PR048_033437 [Dryococelus australis]